MRIKYPPESIHFRFLNIDFGETSPARKKRLVQPIAHPCKRDDCRRSRMKGIKNLVHVFLSHHRTER